MHATEAAQLTHGQIVFVQIGPSERRAIVQRHYQGRIELRVQRASGQGWCRQLLKVWPRDIVGQGRDAPRMLDRSRRGVAFA